MTVRGRFVMLTSSIALQRVPDERATTPDMLLVTVAVLLIYTPRG
jgi:hypothetical protein